MDRRAQQYFAAAAAALLVLFVAAALPYASAYVNHHIDEYHYVESAMRMAATGDWLVPATDEGELRLMKPILPYWLVAAGMAILGETVLGARLFWVLGGMVLVALTLPLARSAGLGRRGALFAAALTASNLCLMNGAVSTTPDMPQAVFLMLAMVGLVQIASAEPPPPRAVWLFWIGIALAALTKGLLALVFLVFAAAILGVVAPRRLIGLVRPLPILVALLLVGSWFGYVAVLHGPVFFEQFFSDQVTKKVAFSPVNVLGQLLLHVGYLVMASFPWLILAPFAWRVGRRTEGLTADTRVVLILAAWILTVVAVFAFKAWTAWLYFLSAMPAVSVLVALAFAGLNAGAARRWIFAVLGIWSALVISILGGAAVLIAVQLAPVWQALAVALGLTAYALALWRARPGSDFALVAALMPLVFFLAAAPALRALVLPDRGAAVAAFSATLDPTPERYVIQHPPRVRSELRLALGQRVPVLRAGDIDASLHCQADMVVAITEAALTPLIGCGMQIAPVEIGWRTIDVPEFLRAAVNFRLAEAMAERRDRIWVAYRGV